MNEWDRRPNEPPELYELLIDFCLLGPRRSLRALWAEHRLLHPAEQRTHVPDAWSAARRAWEWETRAAAFDRSRQARALAPDALARDAGRRRRLAIARTVEGHALRVLESALLDTLDPREARALLPTARGLLRDMLATEQAEARAGDDDLAASPALTGDLIARAEAEFAAEFAAERARLRARDPFGLVTPLAEGEAPLAVQLLLCTGDDPALAVDLAALRAVHVETGLRLHHLERATRDDLAQTLQRARGFGRPIPYLHLACHASEDGVEFRDGTADGAWLSSVLEGVEVLLIAGCRSDRVGDWLGVVPRVITLAAAVGHEEAGALARHFWTGIGLGLEAPQALARALRRCPPAVAEAVVAHW